jgi:hypothetical protein
MFLFGVMSALCLVAGFGLGLYESDVRWRLVEAVMDARPDLEPYVAFARARSFWDSEVHRIHAVHYPESRLPRWHRTISLAAIFCFLASAVFLVLAISRS